MFDNIKLNITELLFSFNNPKNDDELQDIASKTQNEGYLISGNFTRSFTEISRLLYQHIVNVKYYDENKKKECQVSMLKLDMPIQYIGMIIDHSLEDLFNILIEADKYQAPNKHIKNFILDKIDTIITYKYNRFDSQKTYYNSDFIPNNYNIYLYRLFGSGKNYNKVTDINLREQLIAMDVSNPRINNHNNNDYIDQMSKDRLNKFEVNKYEFPLLFYVKAVFPLPKLNDMNFILNINSLNSIIDNLSLIDQKHLITDIVDKYCMSPETSDVVCYKKYRDLASPVAVGIAFNHQLIKEQMASVFTNTEWKEHDIILWTLDELSNERDNNAQSCKEIFSNQMYNYREYNHTFTLKTNSNIKYVIPTNEEACYNFHKLFTNGLLDFSEPQLKEFYSDNLVIGGSAFAFCACSHPYKYGFNISKDFLENYKDSDVDCPILAGDNIYLTIGELEKIVDEKIRILQKYYPGGWKFEKKQVNQRFQITNNYNSTVLEMFSVPYSKNTVWKHFAKYHFGWVRGYFNGFKWYILPSGVISVCSRMSIDIRYCATKHAPHELIYKYLKRGFAPKINVTEFESLNAYLQNKNFFKYKENLYTYINYAPNSRGPCFNYIYRDILEYSVLSYQEHYNKTKPDSSIKNLHPEEWIITD